MQFPRHEYIFVSGLPRSGSTLLVNLFAQNTRIRSDGVTSSILGILSGVQESWDKMESFRSWPDYDAKARVLTAMFHAYYSNTHHPVVIDKNRGWLAQLEMLEMILGERPRVIVCVRDVRAIMASWEKLWRKNKALFALNIPPEFQPTVELRVQHWFSPREHTGRAFLGIQDALNRGYKDCMLFVDYDKLTRGPEEQMRRIYRFIGEEYYEHDFNNVEQKNIEADSVPWMRGLHKIRPALVNVESDWQAVLGAAAYGLAMSNSLWEGLT